MSRGAAMDARDINDMTPLMWAASEGHVDVSEYLIKSGNSKHHIPLIADDVGGH